jgi:hypothetical protein
MIWRNLRRGCGVQNLSAVTAEVVLSCMICYLWVGIHTGYVWKGRTCMFSYLDLVWHMICVIGLHVSVFSCRLVWNMNCLLLYIITVCVVVSYFCCYLGVFPYIIGERVVSGWVAMWSWCCECRCMVLSDVVCSVICMSLVNVMAVYCIKYTIF